LLTGSGVRKKLFLIAVVAILVGFFSYYIATHLSDFKVFLRVSPRYIVIIAGLYLSFLVVNGACLKFIILDFGINLEFFEYTIISIFTTFTNTFLPFRGGAGARAVYLKKKYNLSYFNFVASLAGNYVIVFSLNSAVALIVMAFLYLRNGYYSLPVAGVFLSIFVAILYAIIFAPKNFNFIPIKFVREKGNIIIKGWDTIRTNVKNMLTLYVLALVNLFLISLMTLFEFYALGIKTITGESVNFLQALFLATVNSLSLFISITPASLGIRESLLMLVSNIVNIESSAALSISLLERAISFSLLLLLSPLVSYFVKQELSRAEKPNQKSQFQNVR